LRRVVQGGARTGIGRKEGHLQRKHTAVPHLTGEKKEGKKKKKIRKTNTPADAEGATYPAWRPRSLRGQKRKGREIKQQRKGGKGDMSRTPRVPSQEMEKKGENNWETLAEYGGGCFRIALQLSGEGKTKGGAKKWGGV